MIGASGQRSLVVFSSGSTGTLTRLLIQSMWSRSPLRSGRSGPSAGAPLRPLFRPRAGAEGAGPEDEPRPDDGLGPDDVGTGDGAGTGTTGGAGVSVAGVFAREVRPVRPD